MTDAKVNSAMLLLQKMKKFLKDIEKLLENLKDL
jgi:hypothetical protein